MLNYYLAQVQAMAAMLGERTDVKLYIILGVVAAVLVILSIVMKVVAKKKK